VFLVFLVSGLSGSPEVAQSQVSVGMGLLAGSTVLLLTIIWGTCVIVGKCDIEDSIALDSTDTRGFSLTGMSFHIVHCSFFKSLRISSLAFRLYCLRWFSFWSSKHSTLF
jgi:Ca2+/Na+ antiporter